MRHPSPNSPSLISRGRGPVAFTALLCVLAGGLAVPTAASAEEITTTLPCGSGDATALLQWNATTSDALAIDAALGPPVMSVGMAYVQAAVYNAVAGIEGTYESYRWKASGPSNASIDAAVAAAARGVLLSYFPAATDRVETAYETALADIPDGAPKSRGIRYGERAATHVIDQRSGDGWQGTLLWDRPEEPGVWRPTPPGFLPFTAPWLSEMTPFLIRNSHQFRPGPPHELTSEEYTRDFLEVAEIGSETSATRTPEQTEIALFYSTNLQPQLHAAYRDHLTRHCVDVADAARYLAVATLSVADATITGWEAKFHYGTWRPITAIREADTDGNPDTPADPAWTPLLTTPAHPDYVSGHCIVLGSVTKALKMLDGTGRVDLDIYSGVTGTSRHYEFGGRLKAEGIGARIWGGIHTRTADEVGTDVGRRIGEWWSTRYFGEATT